MQPSKTELSGPERFFLFGFVANDRPLTLASLPTWPNGLSGGALVQKCIGARADLRVMILHVTLERFELRASRNGLHLIYVAVLRAWNPDGLVFSNLMPPIEAALETGREIYIVWKRVPSDLLHCYACATPLRPNTPALFENGRPVCSSYCSLLKK